MFDASVQIFSVLAEGDDVYVLEGQIYARQAPGGADVGVEIQLCPKRHVHRTEAFPHWRRQRALDGYLVAPDRLQNVLRQGGALLVYNLLASLDLFPLDACVESIDDLTSRPGYLRSGTIT